MLYRNFPIITIKYDENKNEITEEKNGKVSFFGWKISVLKLKDTENDYNNNNNNTNIFHNFHSKMLTHKHT